MRIIVANTFVPFVEGGGRRIQRDLVDALRRRSHDVEVVEFPFISKWDEMLEQMLAIRLTDLTAAAADALVAIRTPSYLLRHENKRVWFIHHHRGAYDLWGTPYQDIPDTPGGRSVREAIHAADNLYLREATRLFTNSKVVGERLRRFNELESHVLYPPLGESAVIRPGRAEDFVFYPSRIVEHKRQHLLVEAARHLPPGLRVVIAGAPDDPDQERRLVAEVERHGVSDRVELIQRWITEEEKADLLARCLAVAYLPFDEDSYGYVTLEAFHAAKPVITCTDSGGTLELVVDAESGRVCEPDAHEIAAAIVALHENRALAAEFGEQGRRSLDAKGINWDYLIGELLA